MEYIADLRMATAWWNDLSDEHRNHTWRYITTFGPDCRRWRTPRRVDFLDVLSEQKSFDDALTDILSKYKSPDYARACQVLAARMALLGFNMVGVKIA